MARLRGRNNRRANTSRIDICPSSTMVSYICLKCNRDAGERSMPMRSDPNRHPRRPPETALCRARLRRRDRCATSWPEANVNPRRRELPFRLQDELIAELFVTRSLALNRERLAELKAAEEAGGGRAGIDAVLRGAGRADPARLASAPDNQRSTAARFMIRVSIESVPPIRRIRNREIDHLRKFVAAMRRSLPARAMSSSIGACISRSRWRSRTVRDSERLTKLSEGKLRRRWTSRASSPAWLIVAVMGLSGERGTEQGAREMAVRDAGLTCRQLPGQVANDSSRLAARSAAPRKPHHRDINHRAMMPSDVHRRRICLPTIWSAARCRATVCCAIASAKCRPQ